MLKKFCFCFTVAVSICLGATAGNAAPVTFFDSLGGTTYSGAAYSEWGPSIPLGGGFLSWGVQFTTSSSGYVNEIELEIAKQNGTSGAFKVEIWGSSANLPVNVIYSSPEQVTTAIYSTGSIANSFYSFNTASFFLAAGTYFATVVASEPGTDTVWYGGNSTGKLIVDSLIDKNASDPLNYFNWGPYGVGAYEPAIKITGDTEIAPPPPPGAVPEPATLLLLGVGLIGLAGYGRKKQS